ncbi:hypothetical protein [Longimicrobium sp.]|uniref:hypothetical protein n=1 Tax=Longimicrobium sp. TaxID=2029185 RepID=UPI002E340108|nr:hypothetical protein [Longimicrobium sp.]HEX6038103.1 hypothetical protein [Longimicrobium sp.]
MHRMIGAAVVAAVLALPATSAAQQSTPREPSPFAALELVAELQITPQQLAAITVARDSLREAHRVHCAPMHASTPSEADEARHHAEMAQINARWEGQAREAMTPVQLERLAVLRPAPAAEEHGEDHHAEAPAAAAGHGAHQPAPAAQPAQNHAGHHPRD